MRELSRNISIYQTRIIEWFDHHLKNKQPAAWITDEVPWLEQRKSGGGDPR